MQMMVISHQEFGLGETGLMTIVVIARVLLLTWQGMLVLVLGPTLADFDTETPREHPFTVTANEAAARFQQDRPSRVLLLPK